jgi:putative PEP-CTERM system TPR-repeat lipoprotein
MHNRSNRYLVGIALVSALLVSGLAGCGKQETPAALIAEAKKYDHEGNSKAAIIQLKNALAKSPDNGEARFLLARIYNDTNDAASAEKEIRRAAELGIAPEQTFPVLARALLRLEQPQKVLDELAKGTLETSADTLSLQGAAYLALHRNAEADAAFDKALAMTPDHVGALLGKAQSALLRRDVDTGRKLVDQALARHPQDIDALLFKGNLQRVLGQADAAVAAYDQVLALNHGHAIAHLQKTFTLIEADRFGPAEAALAAAQKTVPSNLALNYAQGLLSFKQGKYAAANESLQQVLRIAPDYKPAMLLAGAVQFALGSERQAEQYLRSYLESDPDNEYARKLLASTLLKTGDPRGALAALGPALANDKDAQLLGIAGEASMRSGNFDKATGYLEKASTLEPNAAALRTSLGLSRIGMGEGERGLTELEQASKLESASLSSGVALVTSALRLHQLDKAVEAVTALEKREPANPTVQNLKGVVYLAKDDPATARATFDKALALSPGYYAPLENLVRLDYLQKKPAEAQKRLEAFVQKNPKSVEGLTALAAHLASQDKLADATPLLQRAAAEDQKTPVSGLRLAAHYVRLKQPNEAQNLLRKIQVQFPGDPDVLDMLGQVQWIGGDKEAALETYHKLAVAMPRSAQAQFRLASASQALGNKSSAIDAYAKALQLQPEYPEAQAALGQLYVDQGSGDKALALARTVQKQQPKNALGYLLEGEAQMLLRQPGPAADAYARALELNQTTGIMIKLHGALAAAGKAAQAQARLADWRKRYPNDMQAVLFAGEASIGLGQYAAAVTDFETVLKGSPDNAVALNNLAWAYFQLHDARAVATAEKALRAAPDNPGVMDTLGWILVEQGNSARGLPLLQKAAQAAPGAADVRLHLAKALLKANDRNGARKELESLLAANRRSPQQDEARTLLKQL